jgi:hypothetical protein
VLREGKTVKKERAKENLQKILKIYKDSMVEKSGFVVRDEDYLKAAIMWEEAFHKVPEEVIFVEDAYVMFKDLGESLCIDEIAAKNKDHAKLLISKMAFRPSGDRKVFGVSGILTFSGSTAFSLC